MIKEAYHNNEYWDLHPSFHEEDQEFKFKNIIELLDNNSLSLRDIIDVGCGSGKFAYLMSQKYSIPVTGIDLDPKVIMYAQSTYSNNNLSFQVKELNDITRASLGILADVFEHVEDHYGFLRLVATKFDYVIFNIPLDLSIIGLIRNGPVKMKKEVFHLHYFYEGLALQVLKDLNF